MERGNLVILAATNKPHTLDPALRRPGRLDREVEIRVPSEADRHQILQHHMSNTPRADDLDLVDVASRAVGYVGSDLGAVVRESVMQAIAGGSKVGSEQEAASRRHAAHLAPTPCATARRVAATARVLASSCLCGGMGSFRCFPPSPGGLFRALQFAAGGSVRRGKCGRCVGAYAAQCAGLGVQHRL